MTRGHKESSESEKVKLQGNLAEFRHALEDEIEAIWRNGQSSTVLTRGRRVAGMSSDHLYSFHVDYLPAIPADTPCKLYLGKDAYEVTVVSYDEERITLAAKVKLPDILASARLENGATILMEKLIQRIESSAEKNNAAGKRLLRTSDPDCTKGYSRISEDKDLRIVDKYRPNQERAIQSAISNDITYIWGPPGTGKSTVIAGIITELIERDRSVLLLSHTNAAIDGAIEKADREYDENHGSSDDEPYPLLRLGIPSPSVKLKKRLRIEAHTAFLGKELNEQGEELKQKISAYNKLLRELDPQISKARWVKENQLLVIDLLLGEMDSLEGELILLRDSRDHLQEELHTAKLALDGNEDFQVMEKRYIAAEQELQRLSDQIDQAKSHLAFLPYKVQRAQDDLVKHRMFRALKAQEESQLSLQAQQEHIEWLKLQIQDLGARDNQLAAAQALHQGNMEAYNRKGTFGKLFVGKTGYLESEKRHEGIKTERLELQAMLKAQRLTLQSFENQYIISLSAREQMKTLIVSDTEENLNQAIQEMKEKLEKATMQLPHLESDYNELEETFLSLQESYRTTRKGQAELWRLERTVAQVEGAIQEKRRHYQEKEKNCREYLDQEVTWCASFQTVLNTMTHHETYDALWDIFINVQEEVESLDLYVLEKEKKDIQENLAILTRAIDLLNRKMQELEKQAILQAKVIGTTLVKSYLNEILQERSFDTVILDEASIASIPALWCAGYRAEKNIVIVGDFKQLAPIVIAKTPMALKWLGTDIFNHSGMETRIKPPKTPPDNFIILDEQFRMEKEIADIANMYYEDYNVELISNDVDAKRKEKREEFQVWYPRKDEARAVQLIDTQNLHAWVTGVSQGKASSRLNFYSASLCVELAFHLLEQKLEDYRKAHHQEFTKVQDSPEKAGGEEEVIPPSILIVAPYKPHVQRINKLIDFGYEVRGLPKDTPLIRAGTIHSFQGSESDIVIFDLVIDEPHFRNNLVLPEAIAGDTLKRMFNVAVTRAKFKLFVVGNIPFCRKRAKNNDLGRLLDYLVERKGFPVQDAKILFPELTYTYSDTYVSNDILSHKFLHCTGSSFYTYFLEDIKKCKEQVIIYAPFMTEQRISLLLPTFDDAFIKGCHITVVTKEISERHKKERAAYEKCEEQLRKHKVTIIHKKGMHEKLIFMDQEVLWTGSLNALSFTGLTGEFMQRVCDKEVFKHTAETMGIQYLAKVAITPHEQCCPICGEEMVVAESDSGGFYWTCVKKDYSRKPSQQYPFDGALRCKCGGLYGFSMKNQPRWACTLDSSHYQYMKESDLRLEKMLKLIPQKEQKAVLKYFEEKRLAREIEEPAKKPAIRISNKGKGKPGTSKQLSLYDLI